LGLGSNNLSYFSVQILGYIIRCPYIVALTANVYAIGERAFLQAGMDDYVSKPYQKEDLIEAVNLFTQKRQLPGMCQRR
jgi:CheY-like chemotaxis protein